MVQGILLGRYRAIGGDAIGHQIVEADLDQAGCLARHENIALIDGGKNRSDDQTGQHGPDQGAVRRRQSDKPGVRLDVIGGFHDSDEPLAFDQVYNTMPALGQRVEVVEVVHPLLDGDKAGAVDDGGVHRIFALGVFRCHPRSR